MKLTSLFENNLDNNNTADQDKEQDQTETVPEDEEKDQSGNFDILFTGPLLVLFPL